MLHRLPRRFAKHFFHRSLRPFSLPLAEGHMVGSSNFDAWKNVLFVNCFQQSFCRFAFKTIVWSEGTFLYRYECPIIAGVLDCDEHA